MISGEHYKGSAILQRIREVCGTTPANTAILRELDYYVNQTRKHPVQPWMLGGGIVGAGDVTGPSTSTDNAIARYDGTTGNVIQNSGVTIDDSGDMSGGGSIAIAKNLLTGNGNAAKPSHSFQGDTGSGMYRAAGTLGFSVSETPLLELKLSSGNTITGDTTVQGDLTADDLTADNLDLANPLPETEGGTGASTAGGARTNLGLGTSDNPQFNSINIGHASDTTLARSSAGNLTIEGNLIYRAGGTDVPITDGGTGASTADTAQAGLVNGATSRTPYANTQIPGYNFSGAATSGGKTTVGAILGTSRCVTIEYTGNATSGRTVTLTGINRAHFLVVQRQGSTGSDDYRYPIAIPHGDTGTISAMYTDGQWFGGFSLNAAAAGTSQVLTINSTVAEVNASGATYRICAIGTPT